MQQIIVFENDYKKKILPKVRRNYPSWTLHRLNLVLKYTCKAKAPSFLTVSRYLTRTTMYVQMYYQTISSKLYLIS